MFKGFLADNVKISIVSTVTDGAAGTSAVTSSAVDMTGYDGCLFVVPMGAIVSGAATSLKVQQCATSGGSYADLTGTNQTIADTDDDKLFYVDVQNPEKQFLKLVLSKATQNATNGGIIAIQYRANSVSNSGITQGTNVSGEKWNMPLEGTA